MRQVPKGEPPFSLDRRVEEISIFLAGGEADVDNNGSTELRFLPESDKLCVKCSTHGILPGQKRILLRNK